VTEDRDGHHPTAAAILLSEGTVKQRTFPYAKIECARFKGTETKVFLDQATFDGPVHASIEPCIAFIKRNIALGAQVGEVYREDRWEYPLEAIREAVTNAVVHRDYSIRGSDIKVAIFDDMLEITSPGPLPDTLAPEALGTGRSEIRNRVLAPIFKELGLIEAWGTGIRRMRAELESYPEVELVLQEVTQAFQVQFARKKAHEAQKAQGEAQEAHVEAQVDLSAIERQVLSTCEWEPAGSNDLLDAVGYETRTGNFKNSLSKLIDLGLVEMTIPDKPRSSKQRYRITPKGREALRQAAAKEQG
jgi:ATP-dependent DNA helicase RecG